MKRSDSSLNRRGFIKKTAAVSMAFSAFAVLPSCALANYDAENDVNIIGPKNRFSPHIDTLVSMMAWMRGAILRPIQGLTVEQLDYLHDPKSNTIGAMLLHLAATERYYQLHTFEGKKWGSWNDTIKKQWDVPMSLGEEARKNIKGNNLEYYLDTLKDVRNNTIQELKKRDDKWLLAVDKEWPWGPTNNYCKWFHVCEHESNHNGQIKWIKSRLPGAKATNE